MSKPWKDCPLCHGDGKLEDSEYPCAAALAEGERRGIEKALAAMPNRYDIPRTDYELAFNVGIGTCDIQIRALLGKVKP